MWYEGCLLYVYRGMLRKVVYLMNGRHGRTAFHFTRDADFFLSNLYERIRS